MKATPDVPPALRELVTELVDAAKDVRALDPDPPIAWAGNYDEDRRRYLSDRLTEIGARLEAIAATLETGWRPR